MWEIIIRPLGRCDYLPTWQAMRQFTSERMSQTRDEIWLLEHPPIYTQGQTGRSEHLIDPGSIPVIKTDRGGQVTYHGPGQVVVYTLLDIARRGQGIRQLVNILEQAVINLLTDYSIVAYALPNAPGVYVAGSKIASLGLRVRHGRVYHGLALNVAMDLTPFSRIHPCGYPNLSITQLTDLCGPCNPLEVADAFVLHLLYLLESKPHRSSSDIF